MINISQHLYKDGLLVPEHSAASFFVQSNPEFLHSQSIPQILAVGESLSILKCILDDMHKFLSEFPADAKGWDAMIASVKSTISSPMNPAELLKILHNYYKSEW